MDGVEVVDGAGVAAGEAVDSVISVARALGDFCCCRAVVGRLQAMVAAMMVKMARIMKVRFMAFLLLILLCLFLELYSTVLYGDMAFRTRG